MIDDIVRTFVAPHLKEQGFKKNGLTWNRAVNDIVQVINIQKDRYSTKDETRFTINVGIFVADVWNVCWSKPIPRFVRELDCYPRFRIGFLLNGLAPSYRDKWWSVAVGVDDDIGCEIGEIVASQCIPFYDSLKTTHEVALFVRDKFRDKLPLEQIQRAVLFRICGLNNCLDPWPMEDDDYWGAFSRAAKEKSQRYLK